MRYAVARFGFQRPYFTTVPAAEFGWLRQCSGLFGCKAAAVWLSDVPPGWHSDTGSCGHLNSHKKGNRRQPRFQTDFLLLPNGDADVRRHPQCVNSQPKWLNGTAFLHQSQSRPSILPAWGINKGGGFYIKSAMVVYSVTCPGSKCIDRHCGTLKRSQFQTRKQYRTKMEQRIWGLCLLSPENTDLPFASRTPPVERQNPEMALGSTKKQSSL